MGRKLATFFSIPTAPARPQSDSEDKPIPVSSSRPDHGPEPPKSVFSSRFLWGVAYPLHLVALGLTIAVLQLSFRNVYFADVGSKGLLGGLDVNESIKAIQFAAKFHEIFMVASLSAIVAHLTRSCLLGKRGVPLGLVSAPFKVGSADYIFSREFFGSITRPYGVFSLGILLTTIFMLALGPASAMALVPTLGWWKIADPYSGLDRPIWVGAHREELWPQNIASDLDVCHTLQNASMACPAEGTNDIKSWATSNLTAGRPANITIVEPFSGTRRRLQSQTENSTDGALLSYFPGTPDLNNVSASERQVLDRYLGIAGITTLTTTASHWVLLLLGGFWNYANTANLGLINQSARPKIQVDKSIPTYEPLVSVRCAAYGYPSSRESHGVIAAPYVRNIFGETGFTDYDNWGWSVPQSAWNFSRPMNAVNFTWIHLQDLDEKVNASIGALFSVPRSAIAANGTSMEESTILPCTVEARWIANELVNDPMASDIISDNVTDPMVFAYEHRADYDPSTAAAKYGASPIINISSDYADLLNIHTSGLTFPGTNSSMTSIIERFVGTVSGDHSIYTFGTGAEGPQVTGKELARALTQKLAAVLGLVVADGLSRFRYGTRDVSVVYHRNSTSASTTSLIQQAGSLSRIYNESHTADSLSTMKTNGSFYTVDVQRWGYGYGLQTKASHFSISMLMLYGCIALGYILWFNIQRLTRPRSDWSLITNKWSSISEMLALAINSPPSTKLDGTCAGIEDNRSWKQIIRIREVEDKHLALVVGEGRDEHPRVQRDVQYGSLPVQPELEEHEP